MSRVRRKLPQLPRWITALGISVLLAATLFAGAPAALAQTSPLKGMEIYSLVAAGSNPSNLYALVGPLGQSANHILRSQDGGRSWTDVNTQGLPSAPWRSMLAVDYTSPNRLFLATSAGLYRTDGGAWALVHTRTDISSLAVEFNNPSVLYAGVYCAVVPCPSAPVVKSTDGGQTWANIGTGISGDEVIALLIDPRPGTDRLYALTKNIRFGFSGQVYRGTRAGNWTSILTQFDPGTFATALAYDSTANALYAGSAAPLAPSEKGGSLFRSLNPDATNISWQPVRAFGSKIYVSALAVDGFTQELFAYYFPIPANDPRPNELLALPLANPAGSARGITSWVKPTATPMVTATPTIAPTNTPLPPTSTPTAAPPTATPAPTATSALTATPTRPAATPTVTPTFAPTIVVVASSPSPTLKAEVPLVPTVSVAPQSGSSSLLSRAISPVTIFLCGMLLVIILGLTVGLFIGLRARQGM